METNFSNVWIDHCTLEASGGESDGYDAMIDMKTNKKYVTVSYSILKNSGRGGLTGPSDSDDENGFVTFHHNLYINIDFRTLYYVLERLILTIIISMVSINLG